MNQEAVKIALRAFYETFIKDFAPDVTGDLDNDADALYHKICERFDLDCILDEEVQEAEVVLNGVKAKGIGLVVNGSDYLMEMCYQHFS